MDLTNLDADIHKILLLLNIQTEEEFISLDLSCLSSNSIFDLDTLHKITSLQTKLRQNQEIKLIHLTEIEMYLLDILKKNGELSTDQIYNQFKKKYGYPLLVNGVMSKFMRKISLLQTEDGIQTENKKLALYYQYIMSMEPQDKSIKEKLSDLLKAFRNGTVPDHSLDYISVGIEPIKNEINLQLNQVKLGKTGFKFLIGDYGSGKTFIAKSIQHDALLQDFVLCFLTVSQETPLHKFDELYKSMMEHFQTINFPNKPSLSIILEEWLVMLEEKVMSKLSLSPQKNRVKFQESVKKQIFEELSSIGETDSSFIRAIHTFYQAKLNKNEILASSALGWLKGEHIPHQIKKNIEVIGDLSKSLSFHYFKSWIKIFTTIGYKGLVIIFDELETVQKLRNIDMRISAYNNLRFFIDEAGQNGFPHCYFLFTGTQQLLEDDKGFKSYQPLMDRIMIEKDRLYPNYREPILYINKLNPETLWEISKKIRKIHSYVYSWNPLIKVTDHFIHKIINEISSDEYLKNRIYPRHYLRILIDILDKAQFYEDYYPETIFIFSDEIINKAVGIDNTN